MDRLCNEIIQLIFFELDDPSAFILSSRRIYDLSQDPYIRAHYFLTRYGNTQAIYWALGRGKLMNKSVFDILLASGAHLSRYLVQVAMHCYFRTSSHFVKSQWVRSVPLPVFTYFLQVAGDMYGNIPTGKGDDDGSIFSTFLKESRFPGDMQTVKWDTIREILEVYKFIPFSHKDPIMAQFPLALAIEPQFLPLALSNGFEMDSKYRDFVFRKMFERPAISGDNRTDDIVRNVRELCRLDPLMFLSRTVAAEVCMEAKSNEAAYTALKKLNQSGDLLFELASLVEDLIKLFAKTRSITSIYSVQVLRQLFTDFPSSDPTVRLVILLTVFISDNCLAHTTATSLHSKLEPLGLTPLTRKDIFNVLVSPFIEKHVPILKYASTKLGMDPRSTRTLVEEVALKCLEVGCKGKTLQNLLAGFPALRELISNALTQQYHIDVDNLPPWDDEVACGSFKTKLARGFHKGFADVGNNEMDTASDEEMIQVEPASGDDQSEGGEREGEGGRGKEIERERGVEGERLRIREQEEDGSERGEITEGQEASAVELGVIGQDTLSTAIRRDEVLPSRSRRRAYNYYTAYTDANSKLPYLPDAFSVATWVRDEYGIKSAEAAVILTHAVINGNHDVILEYLSFTGLGGTFSSSSRAPVTLKHFKLLARLGRAPNYYLYNNIERGAEFFFSEEDYIEQQKSPSNKRSVKFKVKTESSVSPVPSSSATVVANTRPESSRPKRRPRRSAAASVKSYVDPDSDDESIAEAGVVAAILTFHARKRKTESNLQQWVKHLSILLKEEQKKHKETKKRTAEMESKARVPKSEFFKSLASNLRRLRSIDREQRLQLYGVDAPDEDYSEGDDDEYHYKNPRATKRRKTTA